MRSDTIAKSLLDWFEQHARELPWRVGPSARAQGVRPDTYRIWLSEIMLQQTTVATVIPYFNNFIAHWPDIKALAGAESSEVMTAWAGLGYYARARNLIACAGIVTTEHGEIFPDNVAALQALPGIGAYTSAAIAAIAFGRPAAVIDGNVERVVSRLFAIATPLPAGKKAIRSALDPLVPQDRPGEFAEAMMDLGATVCAAKLARCDICPLSRQCRAHEKGNPTDFPVRKPRAARPLRHGVAFVALREDGAVLLRRRPDKGLLGGMAEVPGTKWQDKPVSPAAMVLPIEAQWQSLPEPVVHGFTHFRLNLQVAAARVPARTTTPAGYWWAAADQLDREALPTLMRKVIQLAVDSSQ